MLLNSDGSRTKENTCNNSRMETPAHCTEPIVNYARTLGCCSCFVLLLMPLPLLPPPPLLLLLLVVPPHKRAPAPADGTLPSAAGTVSSVRRCPEAE
jgi:hypothetical protein